ncbi:hypothetical protein SDC9_168864 [bioreactor metagenome]|uniref:Uncharacterized protein n=1 Tax=bioreactor metagenome TaxID=1076179 RepID=A0A645GBQ9_9ZZZZ
MVSFDPDVLNRIYELSLEFGKNWRRPVLTIVQEVSPYLSLEEQQQISAYIEETRGRVETYVSKRYIEDQPGRISELQRQCTEWIKAEFPWMRADTILHAISQAIYYAWHG